jgi:hypothetical protein
MRRVSYVVQATRSLELGGTGAGESANVMAPRISLAVCWMSPSDSSPRVRISRDGSSRGSRSPAGERPAGQSGSVWGHSKPRLVEQREIVEVRDIVYFFVVHTNPDELAAVTGSSDK